MIHRAFPPGRDLIRVPVGSRQAALAGLSLYTPCTRKGVMAHRLAWSAVSLLGPNVLPGPTRAWDPPPGRDVWEELIGHWRTIAGGFDDMAIHQPRQMDRPRAAFILLAEGRPRVFVKLRRGERESLATEAGALVAVRESRPNTFIVPRLIEQGHVEDWHYLVMEPLAVGRHSPAWTPPLAMLVEEIQEGLKGLPRSASLPEHWEPTHGDLAVWNLRRTRRNRLMLIDWEHAGWGPPQADTVYFRVMTATLRGRRAKPMRGVNEAVDYWRRQSQFQLGPAENLDHEFVRQARETLDQLG